MVQMKEFRIVMPLSLDEYEIGQMYTVMKMQQQNSSDSEGVDILESGSFEDDVLGKGQYSLKHYRLQSKAPRWLTAFAPENALTMQEEAWNAYPRCKTVLKCPYFSRSFLSVNTIHKADNGYSENVHDLSKEELAGREVEIIDIATAERDYWSKIVGSSTFDLSKFKSARTGRGPLLEGWRDGCSPVMTAYKLVIVDAPYWGFGRRLEQAMLAGERALFLESHRNCLTWIDEWFGISKEAMLDLEQQRISSSKEKICAK